MSEFSEWLTKQMEALGKGGSLRAVAARVGVSPNTVRMWKIGQSEPQPENWSAIAQAFREDITVIRRLVGHADNPADSYIRQGDLSADEETIILSARSSPAVLRLLLQVAEGARQIADESDAAEDAGV